MKAGPVGVAASAAGKAVPRAPMALGFGVLAGGLVLLVAGTTNSSLLSVAQGKPDKAGPALGGNAGAPLAGGLGPSAGTGGRSKALKEAVTQLGVPYAWGGELEKVEFDCSGLVQWAFGKAGVKLPRTAQQQYNATSRIGAAQAHEGDLVFFGNGHEVTHVGIVVSPGVMLDAPHTGAKVRYERFPTQVGASWGSEVVVGYGRA